MYVHSSVFSLFNFLFGYTHFEIFKIKQYGILLVLTVYRNFSVPPSIHVLRFLAKHLKKLNAQKRKIDKKLKKMRNDKIKEVQKKLRKRIRKV
jgi:hypothetical protein